MRLNELDRRQQVEAASIASDDNHPPLC